MDLRTTYSNERKKWRSSLKESKIHRKSPVKKNLASRTPTLSLSVSYSLI